MKVHIGCRRLGIYSVGSKIDLHRLADVSIYQYDIWRDVQQLVTRLEPSVIQTWLPQMDVIGGIVAKRHSLPWVLTQRSAPQARFTGLTDIVRENIGKTADAIISNSILGTEYWLRRAAVGVLVETVRNAIDLQGVQALAKAGSEIDQPHSFRVVVAGRLVPSKGHRLVVSALIGTEMPVPVELVVVGEGPEAMHLRALCSRLPKTVNARFVGFDKEWWRWLGATDCLVSMSESEGSPNVVLEAMAAECPVLLSEISAHREIADDGTALFSERDARSVGRALLTMLQDRNGAAARAKAAFRQVEKFSTPSVEQTYRDIYRKILEARLFCAQ